MSNKTLLWKCFRLFVIFMLTLGNLMSLPAAALAQDGEGEEPAPAVPEEEQAAPVVETEEAPPVVEEPAPVEMEAESPVEEEPVTIQADEPVEAQATSITFTGGELLGRPTDTSITVNMVPASTIVLFYEYGTASGVYTDSTSEVTATGGQPCEVVISGLTPNTKYYYRMQYHIPAETDWVVRDEHSFWTQRAPDSTFVFTVTADSHAQFNAAHQQAMVNIKNDQPDFHLDLGDTFYTDGQSSQTAVNNKYLAYRNTLYLGAIGPSVPIFLSSGNHEEEEGWNLDDTPFSIGVASIQARKAYYPTPIQDGFYTANTDPLPAIDEATYGDEYREDYYAWEWGDALFVVIDPFQYTMNLPYAPGAAGEGTDDPQVGDQWNWTLGETQYNWFKQTLENSDAKYKFVFSHNVVGGIPNLTVAGVGPGYVRGGAGAAPYFEWGGKNADGSWGFDTQRPGWGTPIHQLMVANGVSAYFHGHDHQFVYEELDGVVYQEMPSPSMTGSGFSGIYSTSNPYTLAMYPNAGHLRITVAPDAATVDYVRSDITAVSYTYTILPEGEDTTAPTVSIEQAASQADPTGASTINFTVTFSESVSDFATGDVTLGGTAGATTAEVTGGGTTYNVAVSGMTASGTVIASLAAGVAHDAADNPNDASTSADNTVTYDNTTSSGVVTLDGTASNATGAANATSVSFSHTTGTGTNRLLLVGASWNCGSTTQTISSVTFTYGSNTLNLSQKVLQETASTAQRFAAIWYSPTEPPQNTTGTVTVTFSGTVSNGIVAGAANFAGVDLTAPFTDFGGANSSTSDTTQSVTLDALNGNEMVFDTVFIGGSSPVIDPTVGSGQTSLWSNTTSNTRGAASMEQAAGSSVEMSWTTGSTASVWAIAAVAINPAAAGTTYDLTMAASPSGGGTTSPAVGSHAYAEGTVVNISAAPAAGYEFDSWTGDVADPASASTTVTMDGNKTVTANFVESAVVALDGSVSNATGAANATSVSFSHTTGTGINRMLLVGASWNCGSTTRTISSITFTYGSETLNLSQKVLQETASTAQRFAAIWYSPTEPPQNTAGTVTVTFSGAVTNGIVAGAANFAGVDQTTPFTSFGGANSSSSGTTQSVTLSSLNGNELVFDTVFIGASTPPDPTVGSGQTKLWSNTTSNTRGAASMEQATGSSVEMSWTTGSTASVWAIAAVAINPAAVGTIYDLTMAVNPSGAGTTSPAVGSHTYAEGTIVNLTATPADGYDFNSWTGDVANPASASTTVTMDGSKTVTANFALEPTTPITFTGTELLGRPEDDSIAVSIVPDENILLYYEYGTTSGGYAHSTASVSAIGGQPQVVTISGLAANTKYYYRMQYSTDGGNTWVARPENTFHTQRTEGSTFSFTITSDAHVDIMLGNGATWIETLNDMANDDADFEIDLGDTVAMDDGDTSVPLGDTEAAEQKYKNVLPYFNIISGSTPVYLLPGNHEQQEAWHLLAPLADSLPIMGKNAEKKFFLNPIPGSFYSGDTGTISYLSGDQMRQAYYAWTWGDALFVVINPFWFTTTKPYTTTVGGGETDTTGSGDRWDWTLGLDQFNWLKTTLENSDAKYKFILSHQIVGGNSLSSPDQVNYGHGGVDSANLVEWGGYNVGGTTWGWDTERAGWGSQPIHQMMVANDVTAFFHGHDHQYAYEMLDGIVYQAVPSASFSDNFGIYTDGGNGGKTIEAITGTGHLKITVGPSQVTSEFIMTGASSSAYTYTMDPASPEYDLTVAVEPSGAGTTIPEAGTHTYEEGDVVDVSAAPASGYVFDHWSGACSGSGACQVTMTGDMSVTAHFNLIPVLAPIGNQTVNVSTLLTFTASGTDTDPLNYSLEDGVSGEVPAGAFIGATSGIFTWTPASTGSSTFDVCVSDGSASDCETITVTVTGSSTYTISGNAGIASATLTYDGGSTTAGLDGAYSIVVAAGWSGTVTPSLSGYKFTPASRTYSNVQASAADQDYIAEASAPPDLPSSFYGVIHILDDAPVLGDPVDILVEGISGTLISTNIVDNGGDLAYSVNVLADVAGTTPKEGGVEGDEVTFEIDGRVVAKGVWHSGVNQHLDFHPPQANAGGPYTGTVGNAVSFSGSATDWGSDASLYAWDWDNDGTYDEMGQTPGHTWSGTGSYIVALKVTDAQGGEGTATTTVTISATTATVTLGNLNQTYDGSPKAVTVITDPAGLSYEVTYNGSTTVPTAAGSYAVAATITEAGYTGGNSGTLEIAKAASVTTVTGGSFTYDGAAHAAVVTVTGAGGLSLTPDAVYAGSCSAAPVTVAEGAACTASYSYAGDANHEPSSDSDAIVINKQAASVTPDAAGKEYGGIEPALTGVLSGFVGSDGISAVYSREAGETVAGSPYTISAVLSPAGVLDNYDITYNTADFTISKAVAAVNLSNLNQMYDGSPKPVTVNTDPAGLSVTVTYDGLGTAPSDPGSYAVEAVVNDANYSGSASGTLVIAAAHSVALEPGWNLVSFLVKPDNTAIANVLASVAGNYDLVYAWDAAGADWLKHDNVPLSPDDLTTLDEKQGFWIHMTAADTLEVTGTLPTTTDIGLSSGWNLVGYPKASSSALPEILSDNGVDEAGLLVYAYHAADTADLWKLYDRAGLPFGNDLTSLTPGWGYWVEVTAAHTWSVPY